MSVTLRYSSNSSRSSTVSAPARALADNPDIRAWSLAWKSNRSSDLPPRAKGHRSPVRLTGSRSRRGDHGLSRWNMRATTLALYQKIRATRSAPSPTCRCLGVGLADDVRLESLTYGTVDATEERQHATSMWHVWHRPRSHPATWAILTVEQDFSHDHQHADLWVDLINCWSPTPRRRARGPSGGRAAASWAV
jgi:hypothetical protein